MKIDILTLFPNMFSALNESIIKRAQEKNLIEINVHNIRDYSTLPHKKCDDMPFGGGAGMVLMCEPIYNAIQNIKSDDAKYFYMSPRGTVFSQSIAKKMSKLKHIIILCGHYEGVDQRIIDMFDMQELSVGDYILTGGEIPAMAVVDAVVRLVPQVIKDESSENESFSNNLLEHNQYTRPADFLGFKVPEILQSGNHKAIADYKLEQSKKITKKNRPNMLK